MDTPLFSFFMNDSCVLRKKVLIPLLGKVQIMYDRVSFNFFNFLNNSESWNGNIVMSFKLSSLIFWLLLLSISLRLGLSDDLLNNFYPYSLKGGHFYQKIHPGTCVTLFLFVVVFFLRDPFAFLSEQRREQFSVFQFSVMIVLLASISIVRFGFGGMAYIVDTFAFSTIYIMLMAYLSDKQQNQLVTTVFLIVIINSVIALSEFSLKYHVIKTDYAFGFFRSSALFGHPLTNSLITATTAITVLKMPWSFITKSLITGLMLLALLTFGGRGSLGALFPGIVLYLGVAAFLKRTTTFNAKLGNLLGFYAVLIAATAAMAFLIFETEIGRPIASRLMMDTSIQERFNSLAVVNNFGHSEILWGQGIDSLESSIEESGVVTIVENFWVVLLLRSGLPLFVVFTASFIYLLYHLIKQGSWIDGIIALVFLMAASTNNSLSTKNVSLSIFFLLVAGTRNIGKREDWNTRVRHDDNLEIQIR